MSNTIYNKYYVYAWLKKTGEPYYIGKGKNQRAWRKGSGKVQILASNLSEKDAFAFEALLIKKLGRKDLNEGPLHNRNDGMIGGDMSSHPNYIKSMKERDMSGDKNPMAGKSRKGEKLGGAVNPLYGSKNGMYGTKRGAECANTTRMTCPLCDMESNLSNIKRHITITHKQNWREIL